MPSRLIFSALWLIMLVSQKQGRAQVFKAVYECNFFSLPHTQMEKKNATDTGLGFDISIKITYTIFSNQEFVEIEGKLEEATSFPGAKIGYKKSADKAIISLEKMLIYFPEEKALKKIKLHEISSCKDSTLQAGCQVSNLDTTILVSFQKGFPDYVTPGLFFINTDFKSAIQSITTPSLNLKLVSVKQSNDRKLDYKELFDSLAGLQVTGEFDFLK